MTDVESSKNVTFLIMMSKHIEINNDPQRRCYDGCHFSTEIFQTPWEVLDRASSREKAEQRLKFWVELNDYAVKSRGPSAKTDYKIVEQEEALA